MIRPFGKAQDGERPEAVFWRNIRERRVPVIHFANKVGFCYTEGVMFLAETG